MARSSHPDSAGSQFFVMVDDAPYLDGKYAAFGKITDGAEEAVGISKVKKDHSDKPVEPQVIKSISVDTLGIEYAEPDKLSKK